MEDSHSLRTRPDDDGFAAAAASAERHLIKGDIAKFVDGLWSISKAPIPKGAQFVPVKMIMAWVKWENQKPVDYVFPRANGLLPSRESLGDTDETEWEMGLDGEPKDPWQNTRVIHAVNTKTAETITITNSTVGMRIAFEALAEAVATMRTAHPHALPVIELSSASMKTQRGQKLRPHFRIVGWKQGGNPEEEINQIAAPKPKTGFETDDASMDDEIPF